MRGSELDKTDRLLNELEDMARSNACDAQFFQQFLDCLRLLLYAESAGYLCTLPPQGTLVVASSGMVPERFLTEGSPASLASLHSSDNVFIVPVQPERTDDFLFLTFREAIPASGRPALQSVCKAFLEILSIRWMQRYESLERSRLDIEHLIQQIPKTTSIEDAASLIVDQVASILSASRVSLIAQTPHSGSKLLAVNTCPQVDASSTVVKQLVAIGERAMSQGHAMSSLQENKQANAPELATPDSVTSTSLESWAALPLTGQLPSVGIRTSMVLEWREHQALLSAMPMVRQLFVPLSTAWLMQSRWLGLPKILRTSHLSPTNTAKVWTRHPALRWILAAAGGLFLCWGATRPVDLTIECSATLEPVSQSTLYASADSYLQTLHVADGQSVTKGTKLVSLRSPSLELQIEETMGQLRALSEKRASLRVALNQTSQSSSDAEINRMRISSELVVLESQEKHIHEKLAFWNAERDRLELVAPMNGVVIARQLHRELQSRPLRRGDPLFQIMDTDGDWQLRISIADRDSGYFTVQRDQGPVPVEFQLESRPERFYMGQIRDVAPAMETTPNGEVMIAFANIDVDAKQQAFMGATAKAYLRCGKQPLWFVWCRPWIESLQKTAWLLPFSRVSQD
jgi:multidrug efflux pump subunit AcrA (membrane-fusion protein)